MHEDPNLHPVRWLAGAALLGLLAWQGHHLAPWLPQIEEAIENLGPWGPVVYCLAIFVLGPLLVPDTLLGLTAGAVFGLVAGTAYYFAAVYAMCLGIQWLSSRWLKARVLDLLASREPLRAVVLSVPKGGVRFAFLVRLVPINPALLSYALGAVGVPLRTAAVGNLGMFTHMFPAVYFSAAAVHMTRMAGAGHEQWETQGVLFMLGLAAFVGVGLLITRRAWAAIAVEEA